MPNLSTPAPSARAPFARTFCSRLAAFGVGLAALLASAAVWADPPGRVGRIAQTQGAVWLFDAEQGEWITALRNRPVTAGDRLSAERDARVELQIGSATLRVDGDSEFEVGELNDDQVRLHLHHGSLALRLRSSESAHEFVITTAEGRYFPQRAGHYRVDQEDHSSFAGVMSGALRFEASDSALEINAGQRAEFWADRGVTHFSWSAPANDRFADWVAQQDRDDTREARRQPYVSPEMTGADDLDRYGDWDRHPEYGAIWFPARIEPGWAPYRYGRWAYVQPWGWTWVDDAPWGFAPFHYGRWISWRGRWAWCPGRYVARPVYAPALVAWIGGPHLSLGLQLGGPPVGWVALSPREAYRPTYNVTNIYINNVNSAHRRWQPTPHPNEPAHSGPITYTNQGVPGGVTVVSQDVLRERKPIGKGAVTPVDAGTLQKWLTQPVQPGVHGGDRPAQHFVPPAPAAAPTRAIVVPGGGAPAVPPAPGAGRMTRWGQIAVSPRVAPAPATPTIRTEGGQTPRGQPPAVSRGNSAGTPAVPPQAAPPAAAPQRNTPERRNPRAPDTSRMAPPQAVAPAPPPVQGVRTVPAAPQSVAVPPTAPAGRAPAVRGANADERDERQAPAQERRREQRPGQQNQ